MIALTALFGRVGIRIQVTAVAANYFFGVHSENREGTIKEQSTNSRPSNATFSVMSAAGHFLTTYVQLVVYGTFLAIPSPLS